MSTAAVRPTTDSAGGERQARPRAPQHDHLTRDDGAGRDADGRHEAANTTAAIALSGPVMTFRPSPSARVTLRTPSTSSRNSQGSSDAAWSGSCRGTIEGEVLLDNRRAERYGAERHLDATRVV